MRKLNAHEAYEFTLYLVSLSSLLNQLNNVNGDPFDWLFPPWQRVLFQQII